LCFFHEEPVCENIPRCLFRRFMSISCSVCATREFSLFSLKQLIDRKDDICAGSSFELTSPGFTEPVHSLFTHSGYRNWIHYWRRVDQIHLGEKESLSRRQRYFINPDHWAPSKPRVHHPDCGSTPRHITEARTRRRRGWPAVAPSCEPPDWGWGRYDTSASASAFHPSAPAGCRAAKTARTSSAFRPAA
jgi:hypothetical protein